MSHQRQPRRARGQGGIGLIAAHPDDEVLSCGGTIARAAGSTPVDILIVAEGATARGLRGGEGQRATRTLEQQARKAGQKLGARSVEFLRLPDNRLDGIELLRVIKPIEAWIARLRPETVYTHHPGDLNIDHALVFRAVLTATRPTSGCSVKRLYACEVPSATEWAFQRIEPVFRPNTFVDIGATLERKVEALRCYEGELRTFPHPRSAEGLRSSARRWGSVAGVEAAEAFELIRAIEAES